MNTDTLTYPASPLAEGENVHDLITEIDQLLANLDTIAKGDTT